MTRRDDLETGVRECYQLVREYEVIRDESDDPKVKRRSQRAIDDQLRLIKDYLTEYGRIYQYSEQAVPQDIIEIAIGYDVPLNIPSSSTPAKDSTTGMPSSSPIAGSSSLADSTMYALVIGIASYRHIRPLGKTTTDAEDVRDTLIEQGYSSSNVGMLLDSKATKSAINEKLDWLARRAGPNDTVVVFFSGHGMQFIGGFWPGEYLCPVEAELSKPKDTMIAQEEFTKALRSIQAGRLVVFLDACHAGGVGEPKDAGFLVKAGFSENGYDQLAAGKGRIIIASSRPDEYSWEIAGLRNSLFTYYLLNGIRGEAADTKGEVWISRLFGYVYQEVSRRKDQHPFQKAASEDFVIAFSGKVMTD